MGLSELIGTIFFVSGLATLLQSTFGVRYVPLSTVLLQSTFGVR